MNRRYQRKWIRIFAFTLVALTLCACTTQNEQPAASEPKASTPAITAVLTATPVPTPIPTTPPEETTAPTPSPTVAYIGQVLCIADEYVNVRAEASKDAEALGKLPAGETTNVISYEDSWAKIAYDGVTGYVNRDYLIKLQSPDIDVPSGDWTQILVNQQSLLPDGFAVSTVDFEGGQVDARILAICKQMFADAQEDGVTFQLVDAYRSYETQSVLYEDKVQDFMAEGNSREDAEVKAATITARPNTSEHQTGLALDIVTPSYTKRNKGFAQTRAFKWLEANAANYGFIMRYADGKADFTGVIFEPWHWRFVGVEAAREMMNSGECLEEYLEG